MFREKDARHCPFCGGHTICVDRKDCVEINGKEATAFGIGCTDCGAWYDYLFPTAEAAVEAWNLRADVSKPDLYAAGWNDAMEKVSRYAGHQAIAESGGNAVELKLPYCQEKH